VKAKYVIIQHANMEVPIVFSPLLQHAEVAGLSRVKSAGFCELNAAGKWVLSGRSDSLCLRPRPQDMEILNAHLFSVQRQYVSDRHPLDKYES